MWNIEHTFSHVNGWSSLDMDLYQVEICALLHLVVLIPPVNSGNGEFHFVQSFQHYLEYIQVFFCAWYSFTILIYIMYKIIIYIGLHAYSNLYLDIILLSQWWASLRASVTLNLMHNITRSVIVNHTIDGNLMQISITPTICFHLFMLKNIPLPWHDVRLGPCHPTFVLTVHAGNVS